MFFGTDLAAGDLDGDRDNDLVILSAGTGAEGETHDASVTVCLAQSSRWGGCRRLLHDGLSGGLSTVRVGNMSGDPLPEIVVDSPGFASDQEVPATVTTCTCETVGGLSVAKQTELGPTGRGIPGGEADGDLFGIALALGGHRP